MRKIILCFVVLITFCSISIAQTLDMDNMSSLRISCLQGKEFCFAKTTDVYIADCFYNADALTTGKTSKSNRYKAVNGVTPDKEFIDRRFRIGQIHYNKVQREDKGCLIELIRDDGDRLCLKVNSFSPNRAYNRAKTPSFADLFIKTDKKSKGTKRATLSGYEVNYDYFSWLEFDVFEIIDSVQTMPLFRPYNQEEVHSYLENEIKNYSLDSILASSYGVKYVIRDNHNQQQVLSARELMSLANSRDYAIRMHEVYKKSVARYDSTLVKSYKDLVGKTWWVALNRSDYYYYTKMEDGHEKVNCNDNHLWFRYGGTGYVNHKSTNLFSMNSLWAMSCYVEKFELIYNRIRNYEWDYEKARNTSSENSDDYYYFIVLKKDTTKTYHMYGYDAIKSTDRLYVRVNNLTPDCFLSSRQIGQLEKRFQEIEDEDYKEFMEAENAHRKYAETLWGKEIADVLMRGEMRFGYTTAMCRLAYNEQVYRESNESTPFGLALCYDFYEKGVKYFFIDDKMIGVQWRGKRITWGRE